MGYGENGCVTYGRNGSLRLLEPLELTLVSGDASVDGGVELELGLLEGSHSAHHLLTHRRLRARDRRLLEHSHPEAGGDEQLTVFGLLAACGGGDGAQQRGLAAPIPAEQCPPLVGHHTPVHIEDEWVVARPHVDATQHDRRPSRIAAALHRNAKRLGWRGSRTEMRPAQSRSGHPRRRHRTQQEQSHCDRVGSFSNTGLRVPRKYPRRR